MFPLAAETYDRRLRQQEEHRQQHMHISKQTRFHHQHHEQIHATTSTFIPDPAHTLSDDEIFNMDYESDDDAFPIQTLIDVVDGMVTCKRESTIEWLRHIATTCVKPNPVLGLLRRIPQRPQKIQMTALNKAERQQRRTLDKVFQRDVVRKIRKWERAVQAGRMNSHTNNNTTATIRNTTNKIRTPIMTTVTATPHTTTAR